MSIISRIERTELIKNGVIYLEDKDIDVIFNILKEDIDGLDCDCEKRQKKIIQIIDNLHFIGETNLKNIYQIVVENLELQKISNVVMNKIERGESLAHVNDVEKKDNGDKRKEKKETKEDKKKRVMLEIINKILVLMDKDEINDLNNFIDIRRDVLLDEKYAKLMDENKEYIFKNGFDKHQCQIYQTKVKNMHISMLKGMLKQIGYTLYSKNHKKMIKGVFDSHTTYSIHVNE